MTAGQSVIGLDFWNNLLKPFRRSVAKSLLLCPHSKKEKKFLYLLLTSDFRKINSFRKKKSLIFFYVPDDSSRLWGIAVNKISS